MAEREVLLGRLTRREFREALERGWFQMAIVATGSIEQHLEHPDAAADGNTQRKILRRHRIREGKLTDPGSDGRKHEHASIAKLHGGISMFAGVAR